MTSSDDIRRIRRDLDEVERQLRNAIGYVRRERSSDARSAEHEIDRALSSLDDAQRRLRRLA